MGVKTYLPRSIRPASNTGLYGCGSSTTDPYTDATVSPSFLNFYVSNGATSGTARGLYMRLLLPSGAGGEAVRAFTTVSSNTPGDTVNGAHISLNFGASAGNVTGLATASRNTYHVPNRSLTGTNAGVMSELYADGASSAIGGNIAFFRATLGGNATGAAAIEDSAYLFDVNGGTNASGNVVGALNGNEPTWASHTGLIRCNLNGTVGYIPVITL